MAPGTLGNRMLTGLSNTKWYPQYYCLEPVLYCPTIPVPVRKVVVSGGKVEGLRNHLDKNISLHLQMMVAHSKRQVEIIAALQTKIGEASASKDGTLVLRISYFSQKMMECVPPILHLQHGVQAAGISPP